MTNDGFFGDFSQVEAATGGNYFSPGQYFVKPKEVKISDVGKSNPKKALFVTFEHEDGRQHTEKFFLVGEDRKKTLKLLGRLQYLHIVLYNTEVTTAFKDWNDMENYWKSRLLSLLHPLKVIIGGEESSQGTVFTKLPFTDYIHNGQYFEEKEYEPGSPEYRKVVKKEKVPASNGPLLNTPSFDLGMQGGADKFHWEH